MASLDRYQCLLSSEYLDYHFHPTVGEWKPLSLATHFRAINCDLTLPRYAFLPVLTPETVPRLWNNLFKPSIIASHSMLDIDECLPTLIYKKLSWLNNLYTNMIYESFLHQPKKPDKLSWFVGNYLPWMPRKISYTIIKSVYKN